MTIEFQKGVQVLVSHGNGSETEQIYKAAKAIWGIEKEKLPQAKFDELLRILRCNQEITYGSYTVHGHGNCFLLFPQDTSKISACSLGTCMVTNATQKCSRCKQAMYCSKEHQAKDWARHKVECIAPQKLAPENGNLPHKEG